MQELLTVLMTWLSTGFGLPADHPHPDVKLTSPVEMTALRLDRAGLAPARHVDTDANGAPSSMHDPRLYAVYDDQTRTIYLSKEWTGATAAESSILVHELVHHLQNLEGLKYDCPEAREKPAYQAQARWLGLFGTSLSEEFGLDPMTLLVRTNCMQ